MSTKRNKRGQRIAYSGAEVKLWNIADGKLAREYAKADFDGSCAAIAVSTDGSILAEVAQDKIRVWSVGTGELIQTISDYYNSFPPRTHAIAISPNNQTVAAIGPHHVVLLWDIKTGKRKLPFPDSHLERVESINCSPKEPIVASGSRDGDVRLWNLNTGKHLRVLHLGEKEPLRRSCRQILT